MIKISWYSRCSFKKNYSLKSKLAKRDKKIKIKKLIADCTIKIFEINYFVIKITLKNRKYSDEIKNTGRFEFPTLEFWVDWVLDGKGLGVRVFALKNPNKSVGVA